MKKGKIISGYNSVFTEKTTWILKRKSLFKKLFRRNILFVFLLLSVG